MAKRLFDEEGNEVKGVKVKKPFYKRWWFIALVAMFIIGAIGGGDDEESLETTEAETVEVVEETELEEIEEVVEEEPEEVEEELEEAVEEPEEENQSDVKLAEINADIAEHMEENRGFALGTLDSNGEPTENGEPNPDFSWALYVHELTYNGNDLEMQTDAGFMTLTDEERTLVANSAQAVSNNYIGLHEDWEATDYQKRLFLTISNGDNALGHSKVLDVTEFTWYD